jgi:hypothetical protein
LRGEDVNVRVLRTAQTDDIATVLGHDLSQLVGSCTDAGRVDAERQENIPTLW